MVFTAKDYEGLGVFYLGQRYDAARARPSDELVLYPSRQLTTHGAVIGMTGSGKTGLSIAILEEALIDGIPVIAIDPKGDLSNLLLNFPNLNAQDFVPWVDTAAAEREGVSVEALAQREAEKWRAGLLQSGQDGARIARLRDACDMAIYTPGSNAGRPLALLRSLAAPSASVLGDAELLSERVQGAVSALLSLVGVDADPLRSREHILLCQIVQQAWSAGQNLALPDLIRSVQSPGFTQVGVFELDTFFPAKERLTLAMTLNNLLAAPGAQHLAQGEPMDIQRLFYTEAGRPRLSVISISHLSDAQRMYLVTTLLGEVLSWVRTQPGTTSLRALLYFDEVFGYFPPTAEPPSKRPMLTLLKQARAFGLGVLLATQNPVDIDYKGLANCGSWFIGRLQTERDKARVLDGLEGASSASGKSFDRAQMEQTLSGLARRVFLVNSVHEDAPFLVMPLLRGRDLQSTVAQTGPLEPSMPRTTSDRTGTPHREAAAPLGSSS